jgi:hypothetical protein
MEWQRTKAKGLVLEENVFILGGRRKRRRGCVEVISSCEARRDLIRGGEGEGEAEVGTYKRQMIQQ